MIKVDAALAEDTAVDLERFLMDALEEGLPRPSPPREDDPRKWPESGLCCVNCGGQSVHEEDDPGDYYLGPRFWCSTCKATFTAQLGGELKP